MCIYKDNKYAKEARSITVEDVNGVTGYSSSEAEYTSDPYTYTGTSTSKQLKTTDEEYKMIFGNSSDISYWVASRCVFVNSIYKVFYVRGVNADGVDAGDLYVSLGAASSKTKGVRPVVVLKSNVRVNGSGTDIAPYTINEN